MLFDLSKLVRFVGTSSSLKSRSQAFLAAALLAVFPCSAVSASELTPHAQEAANLMGIEEQVNRLIQLKENGGLGADNPEALELQLTLVRKIMITGLQLRSASAKFDREITFEQQALDKLERQRDFAVSLTTNANFLQLGILSTIIDGPLEQTKNRHMVLDGNRLNIVSGLTVGALALLALCEQPGGIRHSRPEANLLGPILGLQSPESEQLPAVLWKFLNSPAPGVSSGLTRRRQLTEYWETARVLPINIKNAASVEQVSAFGARYRQRCERIKLITARITMLFDLRAMSDSLNTGLVELLQALD